MALALYGLTVVSGLIDAVSYLGLGHVFAANMTGNVVVVGFALAGAPGFSVLGSITSLAAFLLGAALGGRLTAGRLRPALVAETALHLAAAAVVFGAGTGGDVQYPVIALLALAMGLRNATVRSLGVPDLTTTVLTMTLTGLAAEPRSPRRRRRLLAALAMLAGVVPGSALVLHGQATWALLASAALTAATWSLYREPAAPHPA
ncbi:YoaK family protein [Kitasatospora sp. YST-16]|nr:YoaK family protein [Kitasatospora sp. YST-16]WAL76230.1 YoaK family protein [Kitasatospora sp. YST-16]WNW42276.1 YoaK family protein [Streptomyces sp. Li-HN-5-13]